MGSLPNLSVLKGNINPLTPNYIHRIFEENVLKKPNITALIFEDGPISQKYTYSEVDSITNKIARKIIDSVVQAKISANTDGDYIIGVYMPPSDKLILTLLSIWKSGAAYMPIDISFPYSRIEHIINESKPVMVICEKDFDFAEKVLSKKFDEIFEESKDYSEEKIDEDKYLKHEKDNLAIVSYTSGSTGVPKGVRLTHEVILNRLIWQFNTFPYAESEQICVFKTALSFVDSISEIWGPLLNNRTVLIVPKYITQDPEKLVNVLEKYKVERLVLVPSLLRSLLLFLKLQKSNNLLRNLKIWICSGEPLPVSLAMEYFQFFPENEHILCNFYGSTEIMGDVTYHVVSSPEQLKNLEKVPIGLPIDNTIIYLLDEDLRPVETGNVGELWVSGLNLAAGYVNGRDPERFIPNPHQAKSPHFSKMYKTGDYAKIDKGTIVYEGRTDSQIKVRGNRVDLSEIEKVVCSLSVIEKGVVLCYSPGELDQAILAFVTLKKDELYNELQIESMLQKILMQYMWPQVIILENIPLLVNGKIDRQYLLKQYENTNNNDDTTVQVEIDYSGIPDHQLEAGKILLETIACVLNRSARSAIKIDANFYEIGGNSLNSIMSISKLNEHGYYINISDFIGAESLREVLNYMSPDKIEFSPATDNKFTFEMLKNDHKSEVFKMITDSFYEKADLEQWLKPDICREDYEDLLHKIWDVLIAQNLSFVTKNIDGKPVGASLSVDARDEPEVEITSKLTVIFEFLEFAEGPVRDGKLPEGKGKIFHSFMMATDASLNAKENVIVMQCMEEEVLRIAKAKNFAGIFTTNTSPLTQQLGIDVYGYQSMADIKVNEYIASDGSKPFQAAPDTQRAIVSWKSI